MHLRELLSKVSIRPWKFEFICSTAVYQALTIQGTGNTAVNKVDKELTL